MADDSLDACLQLVADRRRRGLLQQLRHDPTSETSIEEVVDRLLGAGTAAGIERTKDREQLLVQLEHVHLPKLENHGVVEYDLESGTVRYQPDGRIEAVLDLLPEEPSQATF